MGTFKRRPLILSGFEFSQADPNDEPQKFFVGWKFRGSELLDGVPIY